MMILAVTDIHDRSRYAKKLANIKKDLTVVIGDMTYFRSKDQAIKILKSLKGNEPLLFVPGNCDDYELLHVRRINGIVNIHGESVSYDNEGLVFIGLGGSNVTPFTTPIEFTEEEIWETLIKALHNAGINRNSKDRSLILVSHVPPYNTSLDLTHYGEHVGSISVRRFIEEFQPILCLCGHIHEARGIDKIGNTLIVNPGPLMHKFYAIIRIEGKKVDVNMYRL